jgi:Putative Ig domain.
VLVTDAANGRATKDYTVQITGSAPVITATSLPAGAVGTPYSQSPTVSGGTQPFTFSITSGTLPAGLSINSSTGEIFGTPTAAGSSTFTLQVSDKFNLTGSRSFTLQIAAVLSISTASPLPALQVGTASTLSLAAAGGTGPYTWSILSGSLPAGLTLNPNTGAITGTPTAAGPYSFAAQVIDANRLTASKSFTGSVTAQLSITTASLAGGTVGAAYSQSVAAAGGTAPLPSPAQDLCRRASR